MIDFNTLKKLPKNVRDLGKLIVAKGLKKLPKVQKIAQFGHTEFDTDSSQFREVLATLFLSFHTFLTY